MLPDFNAEYANFTVHGDLAFTIDYLKYKEKREISTILSAIL